MAEKLVALKLGARQCVHANFKWGTKHFRLGIHPKRSIKGVSKPQKAQRLSAKPLKTMVPPERLELPTH